MIILAAWLSFNLGLCAGLWWASRKRTVVVWLLRDGELKALDLSKTISAGRN